MRVGRLVKGVVATFEVPRLFQQFRRHRADILLRHAHPAQLARDFLDFRLGAAVGTERRHGGDFVPRQRALLKAGQRVEQPLARTAGCIDQRLRQGTVGVPVNCRQEFYRAFQFLHVHLDQAPAPYACALTCLLGPVFGHEEMDFEHADRGAAGRVALRPAKRLPGACTVAAVHSDRGHALKGFGSQLGSGRFPDYPLKQPRLFPRPARLVVQVAEQRQGIAVVVSRAGELVAEARLQQSDGL